MPIWAAKAPHEEVGAPPLETLPLVDCSRLEADQSSQPVGWSVFTGGIVSEDEVNAIERRHLGIHQPGPRLVGIRTEIRVQRKSASALHCIFTVL